MRGNLSVEHVEVRSTLKFGRSHNILFIMSLLFVSSIGILIDSFKAGAWLGNKCAIPMTTMGGKASTVGGEENAFNA